MINLITVLLLMFFPLSLSANLTQPTIIIEDMLSTETIESKYKKIGSARFTVFFWDIYHSALYSDTGVYTEGESKQVLVFKINYLKDIKRDDLLEQTIEQWQHLNISENEYLEFLPKLAGIWPNISKGDSLTLLVKNQQSHFYFNGRFIGSIEKQSFGSLFLAIWLSPKTSQKLLRKKLLGEHKL
jgi:hypothetical protein